MSPDIFWYQLEVDNTIEINMSSFQPPPPLLPDLISSQMNIPPPPQILSKPQTDQTSTMLFQKQQQQQVQNQTATHEGNNCPANSPMMHTILPNDDSVVQMMMDCSVAADHPTQIHGSSSSDCSSGIHSNSNNWTSHHPSSPSYNENRQPYYHQLPPPPSPPQIHEHSFAQQISQPPQIPDVGTSMVVEEFEKIMNNENDKVVLTNSICLLFRFSIDSVRGAEICQAVSTSQEIMNRLYYVLRSDEFKNDDLVICYATGNLTNISKYDEGRTAILGCMNNQYSFNPSHGVESLIRSIQSRDSNVVIFAITAIHNLLLDRRVELQEIAKEQIKHGLKCIVQLLDNQSLMKNYEFKVIVLDCLQLLAYGNKDNRIVIKESCGPYLLIRTIKENLNNQPTEELIETASRVLKSLSACADTKKDIIENGGISILTQCIRLNNQDILKTCLWTLRNLSDVINNSTYSREAYDPYCINQLVERLLNILDDYAGEPCIITCALGILANLTCNNEAIKQFICECNGVDLLLNTIVIFLGDGRDFRVVDKEILEPAVCALCHLMNQSGNPSLAEEARRSVRNNWDLFLHKMCPGNREISEELAKAVKKLFDLTLNTNSSFKHS